ncbi:hypothetical protein CAPTEDRAFT_73311, partial [Capitella teleta]
NRVICHVCCHSFSAKRKLTRHFNIHLRKMPFSCQQCSLRFHKQEEMDKHVSGNFCQAIKTPTCKICSSTFGSIEELVSHTLSEHKRYLCKRCLNSFSLRCNLHRHERLHSGIKPFPCNLCEKSFARNADLKLHLQKHETCSCTQCSKSFIDMHSLNYHLLKVHHAQDNMHACTICEKAFRSEQQYNKHWESHTNSLANHGQIEVGAGSDQEETNGEEPEVYYTCRYGGCGTQSFGFKAYEDHFFCVHGRFPCKLCDQSFTCKNNRTRHVRNHLGIAKKHTCDRCQKTFTRPDILQEHKMIHTLSYKSDQCNACGATFDRKALLLTHMK